MLYFREGWNYLMELYFWIIIGALLLVSLTIYFARPSPNNTNIYNYDNLEGQIGEISGGNPSESEQLDTKKMEKLDNVSFLQCDFLEERAKEKILKFFREKLDVVISDMAANTTGNKSLDCIRTNQLCIDVVEFSSKILKPNGVLVSKLFMGDDFLEVKELAKSRFKKVEFFKPEASRNESKETYLHCVTLRTL